MGPFGHFARSDRPGGSRDSLARMRSESAAAYQLIDEAAAGSWERVAAWNAFVHQIYADNLLACAGGHEEIPPATAEVVSELYRLAAEWLERAEQLRATPRAALELHLGTPLPHWHTPLRTLAELDGMRVTLDDARVWVASELAAFGGPELARGKLAARLAQVDACVERVELIWVSRRADEIRGAIGDALTRGLDGASVLGQLLARPALLDAAAG